MNADNMTDKEIETMWKNVKEICSGKLCSQCIFNKKMNNLCGTISKRYSQMKKEEKY